MNSLIIILLFIVVVSGCANPLRPETRPPQDMKAFIETEPAWKLSPTLQKRLLELEEKGVLDQQLDLILALTGPLTPAERSRLEKHGVLVRSVIGAVATATAPAGEIPALARFDFVKRIELPTILRPKGGADENK